MALLACGSDSGEGDTVIDSDADTTVIDTAPDTTDTGAPPVDTNEVVTGEGEFGDPCDGNGDCESGWCVASPDGLRCTQGCDNGCPDGWACGQVVNRGTDQVSVCLDRSVTLCHPCATDEDCNAWAADGNNRCLDYGNEGSFCGIACDGDVGGCPTGYACDTESFSTPQCIPDGGSCDCNPLATSLGLATDCAATNDIGTCQGSRFCDADGLTACSAPAAVDEICNNIDDDCDGDIDEGLGSTGDCPLTNAFGTCTGQSYCIGGEFECVGVEAQAEICDGLDQNCDGQADEGFPDSDGDGERDCFDDDDDNDGTPDAQDCAPLDPNVSLTGIEACNGIDDNCDGQIDEENADGCSPFFRDLDLDGFGNMTIPSRCLCAADPIAGYVVPTASDCNDFDDSVYPGATETCNLMDDNCNDTTDEGVEAPCGGCDNICVLDHGVGAPVTFMPTPANSGGVTTNGNGALILAPGSTTGVYRQQVTGWPQGESFWNVAFLEALTPGTTSVSVRVRAGASASQISFQPWSMLAGPFPPAVPPIDIGLTGAVLEVEISLSAPDTGQTPVVTELKVIGENQ